MKRLVLATAVLILSVAASRAHHIWIVPESPAGPKARAYFGDHLGPEGDARTLAKVAHTKLWVRDATGRESPLDWEKGEGGYELEVPGKGLRTICGVCPYGVVGYDHRLRQPVDPYLLMYYPKTIMGEGNANKPWERLPIEILHELAPGKLHLRVLFKGKPLPKAEMMVLAPGAKERKAETTDERGEITIAVAAAGFYGLQSRHIEAAAGEHKGTKYQAVRHYASLVLHVGKEQATGSR